MERINIGNAIWSNLRVDLEHNHDFDLNPRLSGSEAGDFEPNNTVSLQPSYNLNLSPSLISQYSACRIDPSAKLEDYSTCSGDEDDSIETIPSNKRSKSQGLITSQHLKEPEKVVDRQTQSCRWPGESLLDISGMHFLGYYPSEGSQTIEIETPRSRPRPMAYNYSDQLESTRQQDQRSRGFLLGFDKEERGCASSILTPASSMLSPMSSAGANSSVHNFRFSGPSSTSHESTGWYPVKRGVKPGPPMKKLSIERIPPLSPASAFSDPMQQNWDELPRCKKTGVVGEQGGYFIGTWDLPDKMQVIIDKNGEIRSVDRQLSLPARFINSREMEITHPDKSVEIATLSSDGAKIELEKTGVWTAVKDVEVEVIPATAIDHQLRELDIINENRETGRMLSGSMTFEDFTEVRNDFNGMNNHGAEQGSSARGKNNSTQSQCLSCNLM